MKKYFTFFNIVMFIVTIVTGFAIYLAAIGYKNESQLILVCLTVLCILLSSTR